MSEKERNGLIKQRRILREKCEKKDKEIERLNNKIEDLEVLIELIYHEVFLNDEQQKLLNSIIIGGDKE